VALSVAKRDPVTRNCWRAAANTVTVRSPTPSATAIPAPTGDHALRQPERFTIDAFDDHDGKKFLNLRHDFELDIDGLPTVNVTGTDTSYRWVCDRDRFDKCRYDGPD
jgi:hypothetical protein